MVLEERRMMRRMTAICMMSETGEEAGAGTRAREGRAVRLWGHLVTVEEEDDCDLTDVCSSIARETGVLRPTGRKATGQ